MAFIEGHSGYAGFSLAQTDLNTKQTIDKYVSAQAGGDTKLVKPQKQVMRDTIRKNIAPTIVQKGRTHVEGTETLDFIPNEGAGIALAMTLGNNNTVTGDAASGYTHTFNAATASSEFSANGVTFQRFLGGTAQTNVVDYKGMFANSLEFAIPEEGAVTFGLGMVGINAEYGASTIATPTYSAKAPFEGWMGSVKIGADIDNVAAVSMKSCTLSIQNNVSLTTDHDQSTQLNGGRTLGTRSVTVSFEITQEDNLTFFDYFKDDTINAIQINLVHPELAGSSSGAHSLTINLPAVTWLGDEPTPDSVEAVTGSYNMEVLFDETEGYDIKAVLVNSQTGTYAV